MVCSQIAAGNGNAGWKWLNVWGGCSSLVLEAPSGSRFWYEGPDPGPDESRCEWWLDWGPAASWDTTKIQIYFVKKKIYNDDLTLKHSFCYFSTFTLMSNYDNRKCWGCPSGSSWLSFPKPEVTPRNHKRWREDVEEVSCLNVLLSGRSWWRHRGTEVASGLQLLCIQTQYMLLWRSICDTGLCFTAFLLIHVNGNMSFVLMMSSVDQLLDLALFTLNSPPKSWLKQLKYSCLYLWFVMIYFCYTSFFE